MYDTPIQRTYTFPNVDFGASGTNVIFGIAVPVGGKRSHTPGVGMSGSVTRVLIHNVTENFAGTAGGVTVGTAEDNGDYFDTGAVINTDVDTGDTLTPADGGSKVDIPEAGTALVVTCEADGTAGISDVTIDIDWY